MVDVVAKDDDLRPSDVLREAVRRYMIERAKAGGKLADIRDTALKTALSEQAGARAPAVWRRGGRRSGPRRCSRRGFARHFTHREQP